MELIFVFLVLLVVGGVVAAALFLVRWIGTPLESLARKRQVSTSAV